MLILGTYWFEKGGYSAHIPKAIEVGFNEIDIATHYGITRSVGKAIKGHKVLVNSKIWETEYPNIVAKVEEQYNLIGESLNCVSLHWTRRTSADYEAFIKLHYMKKEGWIRKVGLSNVTADMLKDFKDKTGLEPDMVQNESHIGHIDNKTLKYCLERGIEYQGWGSMYGMKHPQIVNLDTEVQARISLAYLIFKNIRPIVFSKDDKHLEQNIKVMDWVKTFNDEDKKLFTLKYSRFDNEKFGFTGRYPEQYVSRGIKRPPIAEFKEV